MIVFETWQVILMLVVFAAGMRSMYHHGFKDGRIEGTNEGIETVLTTLHNSSLVHVVDMGDGSYKVYPSEEGLKED